MSDTRTRAPHAALNPAGRWPKAEKIHRLLEPRAPGSTPARLLEVGTGAGVIAHWFGTQPHPPYDVDAVDVLDQRRIDTGYRFQRVEGTALPFADGVFDVVLSNHVVEHVGDREAQLHHLREIGRVLKPDGQAYLATPNRWQVVEPHFRLAFLSWLPRPLRSAYVRMRGKGDRYDCEPLSCAELEALLLRAGFTPRNAAWQAIQAMLPAQGRPPRLLSFASKLPRRWVQHLRGICPTHIYLLRHAVAP